MTKGTFYFHFAHKEDILLEMGWDIVNAMRADADAERVRERTLSQSIDRLLVGLARRVEAAPRAAVLRSWMEYLHRWHGLPTTHDGRSSFADAFEVLVADAITKGELPPPVDAREVAELLQTITIDALVRWAATDDRALLPVLQRHARIVTAGVPTAFTGRRS